jgi:hypothetical protein
VILSACRVKSDTRINPAIQKRCEENCQTCPFQICTFRTLVIEKVTNVDVFDVRGACRCH